MRPEWFCLTHNVKTLCNLRFNIFLLNSMILARFIIQLCDKDAFKEVDVSVWIFGLRIYLVMKSLIPVICRPGITAASLNS